MTHKLIKTDNYLLVVDDSEIKIDDYYLDDTNSVRCAITEAESYWTHRKHYKKIIAHLPLNGSPTLEGVDLLPPTEDVVEEAEKAFTEVLDSETKQVYNKVILDATEHGFIIGYNKAREKFLLELDKQILDFTHDVNRTSSQHAHFGGALFGLNRLKFYLSQYPTEFECEMDYDCCKRYLCCMGCDSTDDMINLRPKTITTTQGVQWVGKYK
jgi:hypothetical protein